MRSSELGLFGREVFDSMLEIPGFLVRYYTRLGITEGEMVILLHLLYWQRVEKIDFPAVEQLCLYCGTGAAGIQGHLASLIEKNIVTVETEFNLEGNRQSRYSLAGLFDRLAEIWQAEARPHRPQASDWEGDEPVQGAKTDLLRLFEQEFGRPLTPLEIDLIDQWQQVDNFAPELVQEALKYAVLRGVLNFRYLDTILRSWLKKGIRTPQQAAREQEEFSQRRLKGNGTASPKGSRDAIDEEEFKWVYRR